MDDSQGGDHNGELDHSSGVGPEGCGESEIPHNRRSRRTIRDAGAAGLCMHDTLEVTLKHTMGGVGEVGSSTGRNLVLFLLTDCRGFANLAS